MQGVALNTGAEDSYKHAGTTERNPTPFALSFGPSTLLNDTLILIRSPTGTQKM